MSGNHNSQSILTSTLKVGIQYLQDYCDGPCRKLLCAFCQIGVMFGIPSKLLCMMKMTRIAIWH